MKKNPSKIKKKDRSEAKKFVDSLRKDQKQYTILLGEYKGEKPDWEGQVYFKDRRDLWDWFHCIRTLGKHYWIPTDCLNIGQKCKFCGKIRE